MTGSVLRALDGVDEAVREITQAGFLELFTELAEVLSAELVQQLHAEGVDPLRVPRFSVLRLRDEAAGGSLLSTRVAAGLLVSPGAVRAVPMCGSWVLGFTCRARQAR